MHIKFDESTVLKLRLASYNIRKAVGLDYRRDPARILRVLNDLNADVVAIQEADKRLGNRPAAIDADFIEAETDLVPAKVAKNEVSVGWHGNAILVRKNLQVDSVEQILLQGLEPRGAVRVNIKTPNGELSIFGTHLGLLRVNRRRQLSRICNSITPDQQSRSVILGDFNEWNERRGLESLHENYNVVRPGKSFHSAWPVAGLDRIALGSSFRVSSVAVHVTEDTKIASDHLPILADVELVDR